MAASESGLPRMSFGKLDGDSTTQNTVCWYFQKEKLEMRVHTGH